MKENLPADRGEGVAGTLLFGMLLALSGGLMDAYSYLYRGEVFANAQTGNILLMGVHLSRAEWQPALKYAFPVLAFSLGIALAYLIRHFLRRWAGWQRVILLAEAVMLAAVAFIPGIWNNVANALISFVCGIQLEAFRTIDGNQVATTMCIGNLRCAIGYALDYGTKGDRSFRHSAAVYTLVILAFVAGAILGGALIGRIGAFAILGCSVTLLICAALHGLPRR